MEKATLYDYARMCSSFDLCDDCNEKMIKDKSIFTYSETYKYKCPKCGKEELSFVLYPSIIYEDIKK